MSFTFFSTKIFNEFRYSILLAFPLIAAELIYALNGFIATFMVAHLDKEHLAANALVWEIYVTVIVFFIGIICSVSIMTSQSFGAKDDNGIGLCFKQGIIVGTICVPPAMLILWLAPNILVLTGQDPAIIKLAKPFFWSLIWAILPLNIMMVIEQFLIGINKTRAVMLASISMVPIQIFFYYIFLFGKLGSSKLGLSGIGYAITITYCLIIFMYFCYMSFSKDFKNYQLFKKWFRFNKKFFLDLINTGLPLGFMFSIEVALFSVVAIMMGIIDTNVLAAYQISNQFLMLALAFIFALTQTVAVRVGNEVGKNNRNELKLIILVNIGISFGFMLLFSIFYIYFPHLAIGFDIDINSIHLQELVKEATILLSISGILILINCLRLISAGALRGLKDTTFSMFVSIFGCWCIAFPTAYLLAFKFKFGGAGILWGVAIGFLINGIILFIRYNNLIKHIDLVSIVTKTE